MVDPINQALDEAVGSVAQTPTTAEPSYKVIGDTKIPVSKAHGKVWSSRRDAAKKMMEPYFDAYKEALKYYNNDQLGEGTQRRSTTNMNSSGNRYVARKLNDQWSETENIVFSNVCAMVPALYAKNPVSEFTAVRDDMKPLASACEKLVNTLAGMKAAPGLNIKTKAKKCVAGALLTNRAWIEVGYTLKDDSTETAVLDLQRISQELVKAQDIQKVLELEGQLKALEEVCDCLRPEGPFVRVVSPFDMLVDPDCEDENLTDANWIMRAQFLPVEYVRAKYGQDNKDGQVMSIYQPTHVLLAGKGDGNSLVDDIVNNFSLFKDDSAAAAYGYSDSESFNKAKRIKCWTVWDRVTRRVYLYNDKDWSWPLWVWDDPYRLDNFFPFVSLAFHTNPFGVNAKGEVTYYLDQQDAINEINDEERRARAWVRRNILYDKNRIAQEDVDRVLSGPDGTARGVDVPDGATLKDVIFSFAPPSLQYRELFNKETKLQAIDRISSVTDVIRGVQFKTNTTNKAIENYNSATQMRVDEKTDAVEDWLGDIFWLVAQLCLQFMPGERVSQLIGPERAAGWRNMTPDEIRGQFAARVVGGSTQKPTSRAKKSEALELGQVLGQFVNAAPGPIIEVLLRVFEQSFDEVVMTEEDWKQLREAAMTQMAGGSGEGGSQQDPRAVLAHVAQALDNLPPEAKQAVMAAMQKGAPLGRTLIALLQQTRAGGDKQTVQ